MKIKQLFEKLIKDSAIKEYSLFRDKEYEYVIFHLDKDIKLSCQFNNSKKYNYFDLTLISWPIKIEYADVIDYFYRTFIKEIKLIKITLKDYENFFSWLKYEKKRKLLWITEEQAERIFVEWEIDIHPKLKQYAYDKWFIHLSVMSLNLRRPIILKILRDVEFPLKFSIKWIDIVSPGNYEDRFNSDFYLDCWYGKDMMETYRNRWHVLWWECWWKSWKPYPIKIGSKVKMKINMVWTPELWDWWLTHTEDEFFSCWVDIHKSKIWLVTDRNKLEAKILSLDINDKEMDVAKIVKKNIKINNFPIPLHFKERNIVKTYLDTYFKNNKYITWHLSFKFTSYDEKGNIVSIIKWWRASPATQIIITWLYWLKVVLYKIQW